MKEEKGKVLCPICGGPTKLEMYESSSYFQCKHPTHRMTLPEYSDLMQGNYSEEEIKQSISERAQKLKRQHQESIRLKYEILQGKLSGSRGSPTS